MIMKSWTLTVAVVALAGMASGAVLVKSVSFGTAANAGYSSAARPATASPAPQSGGEYVFACVNKGGKVDYPEFRAPLPHQCWFAGETLWHFAALPAVIVVFGAGVPAAIATGAVRVGYARVQGGEVPARSAPDSPPRRLIVPDLVAVVPTGITAAQVSAIGGLAGVRAVLAVAGGRVVINGRTAGVLGVPPAFRSWTPPATAADAGLWARLPAGRSSRAGRPRTGSGSRARTRSLRAGWPPGWA
jgi:hypothetical protein